ncbi:uncharacterized protein LOC129246172 [Anastrepha obliqua]|uniref:uncharacterized protein LOC129246172 n=1 Tax=Anastrepha obliqua TaxID=95512 RepID=UPI002408F381|nr:uncharacterized protein LOC129246172 [Anastrepha obliqua]
MPRFTRIAGISITLLFCAKTFFISFYALNQYPRYYYLDIQKSEYAEPTTYLWITCLTNLGAFISGFWLFAGLCEDLFIFFSPAFFVIIIFLVEDFLLHCILIVIVNVFHMLMIFNFVTTLGFAMCMYIVYSASEDFNETNPEQILQHQ